MPVNFTGGSSGNRNDAAPPNQKWSSQPVVLTDNKAPISAVFPTCKSTSPESSRAEANMPTGGTNATDSNY